MKQIVILGLSLFFLVGCMQKTLMLSQARPSTVIYEEPVYQEPVVYQESVPQNQTYEPPVSTVPSRVKTYSVEPIKAYDMLQGDPLVMLLDVRTKQEQISDGKIANSTLIPLHLLAQNLHRLDKSKTILVYCHVGNRSWEAIRFLTRNGFQATDIKGGIRQWKAEHLPVSYGR